MNNKVLVELIVPELEQTYNVYLPISRRIGNIISLLIKAINELGTEYKLKSEMALYSSPNFKKYQPNELLYNTDIRSGSTIILL